MSDPEDDPEVQEAVARRLLRRAAELSDGNAGESGSVDATPTPEEPESN
jgi:hypothetical protein